MAQDIKQKIVLDGEQQYKAALKDAQRELRTLRSELKAETAELGKNATEQEKNAVKVKNLQKQIAEQEKIVKTYTEALAEVKEKYADNQDEIAKWEIKLNDARTALANMKNGLTDTGAGLKQTAADMNTGVTAAQSFAQAFEGLASIGDSVSGALEGIFGGVLDTVRQAVGELWNEITTAAAKANNWTDLGNYFGSSAEEMQLLDRAITATAGDFSKFTTMVTQLAFGGKNQKIAEWFGISDENYTNNVEYTMAVLDAMSKAYKEWGTGGKWDNAMADIFGGKKSADVSWFVTNLDGIRENMAELSENGYLLDEDSLETMNEIHLELNSIESKWDALKAKIADGFGSVTLDIATNVSGALDALARYFDAETDEERDAALDDLEKNITEGFQRLAEAIRVGIEALNEAADKLKESEDPIVRTIGNILSGLGSALEWLTEDNMENAKNALLIFAGVWGTAKVLTMITSIGKLAANMTTLMAVRKMGGIGGLLSGLIGGSGAETAAAETAAADSVTAGGGTLISGATGALGLIAIMKGFDWAKDRRTNAPAEVRGTDENFAARTSGNDELYNLFVNYIQAQKAFYEDPMNDAAGEAMEAATEAFHALEGWEEIMDAYSDWLQEHSYGNMSWELPDAGWWKKDPDENGVTSEDIQGLMSLPGDIKQSVGELVGSINFTLDGERVAWLLTPKVSQRIAAGIFE